MDPKEFKKLQGTLKKDQAQLKTEQAQLKTEQEILKKAQVLFVEDQNQLAGDSEALTKNRANLANECELLADNRKELDADRMVLEAEKGRLGLLSVIEPVEELEVNPKWLKDRIFKGKKEGEAIKKPGKKTKTRVFIPFERPMETADVLSFRIDGNEVVLITADGQKLRVKK